MDFNNGTFASFVQTCFGFNPYDRYDRYDRYGGSKASVLRDIWLKESFPESHLRR